MLSNESVARERLRSILDTYSSPSRWTNITGHKCYGDLHLHETSQVYQLNAVTQGDSAVPIDFLGNIDNRGNKLHLMLHEANQSNSGAHSKLTNEDLGRLEQAFGSARQHSATQKKKSYFYTRLHSLRDEALDHAVANVYAQDMICLGLVKRGSQNQSSSSAFTARNDV
jgi:hypothetical protein